MKAAYPIQDTVQVITITKQLQKIRFQVRHPENVSEIIGIAVTSTVEKEDDAKGNISGYLTLSLPQKGDVAYSENVRLDNNDYTDLTEKNVFGVINDVKYSKKNSFYFETCFPVGKAILEGFYEDVYSPSLFTADGKPKPFLYNIRVYIRYKVKSEPCYQNEKP